MKKTHAIVFVMNDGTMKTVYCNFGEVSGIGKSRITDEEWQRLCDGYKKITGEEYSI